VKDVFGTMGALGTLRVEEKFHKEIQISLNLDLENTWVINS